MKCQLVECDARHRLLYSLFEERGPPGGDGFWITLTKPMCTEYELISHGLNHQAGPGLPFTGLLAIANNKEQ